MTASATAVAVSTTSRWRKLRRRMRSVVPHHVADAAYGADQARLAARLGLAPQVADVHVEGLRARPEVVAPHALEDLRPRQHLARIAHEQLEQQELRAGQLDQA